MSDFPYIQEPESLRLELNQVRAALKQAQERTQKAEEQGIAEGRIVHKCNLRIEQLEVALEHAQTIIKEHLRRISELEAVSDMDK
ncbi:hypothetical protein LCGC14_0481490 [marine sediment metagenome]|uniref:Uncharacterized protein n=1 Tax=marine sediment metagenome TaxID=412755 RepID=A0A0F9SEG9_9ZZZZ